MSQGSGRSFGFKPSRITNCLTQESLPQSLRVSSRRRSLKTLAAYRSLARREWAFIYVQIAAATAKLVMDRDTSCQALVVFANPLSILPKPLSILPKSLSISPSPCCSCQALRVPIPQARLVQVQVDVSAFSAPVCSAGSSLPGPSPSGAAPHPCCCSKARKFRPPGAA